MESYSLGIYSGSPVLLTLKFCTGGELVNEPLRNGFPIVTNSEPATANLSGIAFLQLDSCVQVCIGHCSVIEVSVSSEEFDLLQIRIQLQCSANGFLRFLVGAPQPSLEIAETGQVPQLA